MKLFAVRKDGGKDSNVTGYWLIEWKSLFSIALLRFDKGSREAYHSHAFNCVSWVLKGELLEERLHHPLQGFKTFNLFRPSGVPLITTRDNLHKVYGIADKTWVLTFRGPWSKTWKEEFNCGKQVTLSNGRSVIEEGNQ